LPPAVVFLPVVVRLPDEDLFCVAIAYPFIRS
jgi:hypothetical protein